MEPAPDFGMVDLCRSVDMGRRWPGAMCCRGLVGMLFRGSMTTSPYPPADDDDDDDDDEPPRNHPNHPPALVDALDPPGPSADVAEDGDGDPGSSMRWL